MLVYLQRSEGEAFIMQKEDESGPGTYIERETLNYSIDVVPVQLVSVLSNIGADIRVLSDRKHLHIRC